MKDKKGNVDCNGLVNCRNSAWCDNSTGCNNSTGCDNSTGCNNSTWCDNSAWCNNSTRCNNSAYCIYCNQLTLEKFCIFNKSVKTKDAFNKIKDKIQSQLGYWKRPEQLTDADKKWLKENVKQFNEKILNEIIKNSITPEKPKEI